MFSRSSSSDNDEIDNEIVFLGSKDVWMVKMRQRDDGTILSAASSSFMLLANTVAFDTLLYCTQIKARLCVVIFAPKVLDFTVCASSIPKSCLRATAATAVNNNSRDLLKL